jgi:hypothetical protein
MMASIRYGFIVLSMPKCASTSLHEALTPICDIRFRGRMKHVDHAFVAQWVVPMLAARAAPARFQPRILSLMRDPVEWLYSWYRYAYGGEPPAEPKPSKPHYARFADFLDAYFSNRPPRVGGVHRQSDFLRGRDGSLDGIEVFRHEQNARLVAELEALAGAPIALKVTHRSRARQQDDLDGIDLDELRRRLADEYAIYDSIAP